jgi:hypothetical protein
LFLVLAIHAQEQKRLAILNTEDDGEPSIESTDLGHLTNRLREIALNALPKSNYSVMTQQSIIDKTGSRENAAKACKEAQGCLAQLGRKISAAYVGQARLGRFGGNLTISMELYNSISGDLIDSFTGEAKDVFGLRAIIDKKAPALFEKMQKRYLVSLSTDPSGAALTFDGKLSANCIRTPCKAELREAEVRIIAELRQHQTADTTISITHSNQSIEITLMPILDIEEPYTPAPFPAAEPVKPIKTSLWVAIGLDVLGAVLVYAGYSKDKEMERAYDEEYRGHGSDFDVAWKNVESNRSSRNAFYVIGGLVLVSGIGVHIWF